MSGSLKKITVSNVNKFLFKYRKFVKKTSKHESNTGYAYHNKHKQNQFKGIRVW